MSHKVKDGILIDNSYYIIEEKKKGFPFYMRFLQLLAIIAGSWSGISILVESFAIPVPTISVDLVLVLTGVIFFFLFLYPSYDTIKIIFGAVLYCLFWYSRLPRIINGFYIYENLVIDRLDDYYGYHTLPFLADYQFVETDSLILLVMIIIPIIALLSLAIMRSKFISICNIILFIPVSASFAFGVIPSERYLIVYLMVTLYLTKSYITGHQTINKEQKSLLHRVNSRAALWLSIICLMIFLLMKVFVSPEKYEEVNEIKEVKSELQSFLLDLSSKDFTERFNQYKLSSKNTAVGGLSGGQLGTVGEVKFTEARQLLITAPYTSASEGIYLKGYVGSEYTGSSWEGHSDEYDQMYSDLIKRIPKEIFEPINQTSKFLNQIANIKDVPTAGYSYYKGKMKVNYLNANRKYIYAPYYTDYSAIDYAEYRQDLYTAPTIKSYNYEFDYFFDFSIDKEFPYAFESMGVMQYYTAYEKLYRSFVYDAYTKLPENGLKRLKQEFADIEVSNDAIPVIDKIEYVKDYLNNETKYSLSPGILPEGKDFVEYFLYENNVGYCAHYASAAALMLRAMGVPTRYIEGYATGAVNINQSKTVEEQTVSLYSSELYHEQIMEQVELIVRDSNAHAWVEVYIDGRGWIPVEFTPASGVPDTTAIDEDMMITGEDDEVTEEPTATPTVAPVSPTTQPDITESVDQPEPKETTHAPEINKEQITKKIISWKWIIIIAIGIIGLLVLSILVYKKLRLKSKDNHSRSALLLYKKIEKILCLSNCLHGRGICLEDNEDYVKENCSYIEKDSFVSCMSTVRKARFGKNMISLQDLMIVEKFYSQLYREVYQNSHFIKRIYIKIRLLF